MTRIFNFKLETKTTDILNLPVNENRNIVIPEQVLNNCHIKGCNFTAKVEVTNYSEKKTNFNACSKNSSG